MVPSRIRFCCAATGTPVTVFSFMIVLLMSCLWTLHPVLGLKDFFPMFSFKSLIVYILPDNHVSCGLLVFCFMNIMFNLHFFAKILKIHSWDHNSNEICRSDFLGTRGLPQRVVICRKWMGEDIANNPSRVRNSCFSLRENFTYCTTGCVVSVTNRNLFNILS